MNDQRYNILQHMRKLWNSWRGSLHKNLKSKSWCDFLKEMPKGLDKIDWEWLVKEHFFSDKFKVRLHTVINKYHSVSSYYI